MYILVSDVVPTTAVFFAGSDDSLNFVFGLPSVGRECQMLHGL